MAPGEGFRPSHTESCHLQSQGLVNPSKNWGVMPDTGSNGGAFYDSRFFDPATLYNKLEIVSGLHGTTPAQQYTYGTVHFVLKGDRGEKVSITLTNTMYNPNGDTNIVAPARLHAYSLATVVSPDTAQSGLRYDVNKPTVRKFATFIEKNGLPYLRPCEIGVSAIARRLAWLSNLKDKVPHVWAVLATCGQAVAAFACGAAAGWLLDVLSTGLAGLVLDTRQFRPDY